MYFPSQTFPPQAMASASVCSFQLIQIPGKPWEHSCFLRPFPQGCIESHGGADGRPPWSQGYALRQKGPDYGGLGGLIPNPQVAQQTVLGAPPISDEMTMLRSFYVTVPRRSGALFSFSDENSAGVQSSSFSTEHQLLQQIYASDARYSCAVVSLP